MLGRARHVTRSTAAVAAVGILDEITSEVRSPGNLTSALDKTSGKLRCTLPQKRFRNRREALEPSCRELPETQNLNATQSSWSNRAMEIVPGGVVSSITYSIALGRLVQSTSLTPTPPKPTARIGRRVQSMLNGVVEDTRRESRS